MASGFVLEANAYASDGVFFFLNLNLKTFSIVVYMVVLDWHLLCYGPTSWIDPFHVLYCKA